MLINTNTNRNPWGVSTHHSSLPGHKAVDCNSLRAAIQHIPFLLSGPSVKSISLHIGDKGAMQDCVKWFAQVWIDDISCLYCFLSTAPSGLCPMAVVYTCFYSSCMNRLKQFCYRLEIFDSIFTGFTVLWVLSGHIGRTRPHIPLLCRLSPAAKMLSA